MVASQGMVAGAAVHGLRFIIFCGAGGLRWLLGAALPELNVPNVNIRFLLKLNILPLFGCGF